MLKPLLERVRKPKPTGVVCEYCGWKGAKEDIPTARVMNTDSSIYNIRICPRCQRNGGLYDYDAGRRLPS